MKTKDRIIKEKIVNKNPSMDILQEAAMGDYSDQKDGIVRIARDSQQDSDPAFHTMQEHHNANHALYYFNMLADGFINGRSTGNDCRKLIRAREHLMNLREFVSDENKELKSVIEMLLKKLEEFCPVRRKQFGQLLIENWPLMRTFSGAYLKKEQRCLTEDQLTKLKQVLSGRCFVKLWWWKSRFKKVRVRVAKFIKKVTK